MKYVFGPVPSRRLGQSLGIDLVPLKTCNWNCVYCQLGRSRPLTNTQREYVPRRAILEEISQSITRYKPGEIDWVTFVGSGEPTLHSGLGWLISEVKALTNLPVAVITNGARLYQSGIRAHLAQADAVLPSLDAGNPSLYRKINRPWPKLTFEHLVEGLVSFRREYQGKLWLEIMLIRGLNDTEDALMELAQHIARIRPDQVHLLLPDRPPCEAWVQPSDKIGLRRAEKILGVVAPLIIPQSTPAEIVTVNPSREDLKSNLLGIITRHPMEEEGLCRAEKGWSPDEVRQALQDLQADQKAQVVVRYGKNFWSAAKAFYGKHASALADLEE